MLLKTITPLALLASLSLTAPASAASTGKPDFKMPFPCGQRWQLTTYKSHSPEDKKLDMFHVGASTNGSAVVASAAGVVREHFAPGGLEIDHGGGWFTVYLHMSARAAVGARVAQGQWIGTASNVGTGKAHLHYEQLRDKNNNGDGENGEIEYPTIQGQTYQLREGQSFPVVASTNTCSGQGQPPGGPAKHWVDTFAAAPGRRAPAKDSAKVGVLNAGTNYVWCKKHGQKVSDSRGSYNHYWLWTDLDSGEKQGWVSAYYLSRWGNDQAKDNNGSDIPNC